MGRVRRRTGSEKDAYVLSYTIGNVAKRTGETRKKVKKWLLKSISSSTQCPFCQGSLALGKNIAVDHMEPISRGGSRLLSNCWIVCQPCNRAKGDLNVKEFTELRGALSVIGSYALKSVLARLKLAGFIYRG